MGYFLNYIFVTDGLFLTIYLSYMSYFLNYLFVSDGPSTLLPTTSTGESVSLRPDRFSDTCYSKPATFITTSVKIQHWSFNDFTMEEVNVGEPA